MIIIRSLKYTLRILVTVLLGLYVVLFILLDIPFIQQKISTLASQELSNLLQTEVKIGGVKLGLLNQLILEDVSLQDQSAHEMLEVTRLAAQFDIAPLFKQRIVINSLQLFDFTVNLNRQHPEAIPNYQFLLDALASKDTITQSAPINLRLNTVLIRRGDLAYHVASAPETPNQFNPNHISVTDLFATLSIKALQSDSINASIRRLSFKEQSGLSLSKLSTKVVANSQHLQVSRLSVELPHTLISIDTLQANYDSLPNLFKLSPTTTYKADISGQVVLSDIAPLIPQFTHFHSPIQLRIKGVGVGRSAKCSLFNVHMKEGFSMVSKGDITNWDTPSETHIQGEISEFSISESGKEALFKNLNLPIPGPVKRVGYIHFHGSATGKVSEVLFKGILQTDAGAVQMSMRLDNNLKGRRSYSGQVISHDLNLGKILDEESLGEASLNLSLKGFNYEDDYPESYLKGNINSLNYNGYTYTNITLDGLLKKGGFLGSIALEDPNGTIQLEGKLQMNKRKADDYQLTIRARDLRLDKLYLLPKHENLTFSFNVLADFSGTTIDNMDGVLSIDSLQVLEDNKPYYQLDKLKLSAEESNGRKRIELESNFVYALVEGDFSYATLPQSILQMASKYLPTLIPEREVKRNTEKNDFSFNMQVSNTEILSKLFLIPVELELPAKLDGYFYESENRLQINGYIPSITYKQTHYDSSTLLCDNLSDRVSCQIRTGILLKSGAMLNVSIHTQGKEDQLNTVLNWWNNTENTFGGKLVANAYFEKEIEKLNDKKKNKNQKKTNKPVKSYIQIKSSQVVLNDTTWNIHPSQIKIDADTININNFYVENQEQHLRINGSISPLEKDSCTIELKRINVGYVLDMVQFYDVLFNGWATGKVTIKKKESELDMRTQLYVENFSMNKTVLGNADIKAHWDNELGDIVLAADINEKNRSRTQVAGYISPVRKRLDLQILAGNTHLGILTPFVKGIVSEIDGRATGKIRLFGDLKYLDLEGAVKASLDTKVDVLNTYFQIREDSVFLRPGEIVFNDIVVLDREGHSGRLRGGLFHTKLKEMNYNFVIEPNKMLLYNTTRPDDLPFYGKVYGTGRVELKGNSQGMEIDANIRTEKDTEFTYNAGITTEAASNQFITFVDKTPKRVQDQIKTDFYHPLNTKKKEEEGGTPIDLRIKLMIEATPDATMRIIVDPLAGDNITTTGRGNMQVNFYNKGDLHMFGTYVINSGAYKLSIQEVFRKEFTLNPGGTVSFAGDPSNANLNLQAKYTVNSASIRDLGMGVETTQGGQSSIQVECLMNLTGSLANPTIKFDLGLPTVSSEDRELIRSVTQTEEQMNTQIIYLLSIGKFYAYDYANAGQSSNATSSLAFNTISGQLNNMLAQIIDSKNWDVGANFSTGEKGWTDVEAQAMLSGRLFNNRLLINGQFGYRENTLTNNNFMGDFEAIYLLEQKGEWKLKGYSKTNERFFIKSTLTTQGIGVMYEKVFDAWKDLFNWVPWKRKEEKESNQK